MKRSPELEHAVNVGMNRAASAAENEPWYQNRFRAFVKVVEEKDVFDAVDIWNKLRTLDLIPADPKIKPLHSSAMGAFLKKLQKAGVIVPMDTIYPRHDWGHGFHYQWRVR